MKKFALFLTCLVTMQSYAATILQCNTTNHKQLQLLDLGDTLRYSFGKKGKPELIFSVPKTKVTYNPWQGFFSENYSIDLQNDGTTYHIFTTTERNTAEHTVTSGVDVHDTTIKCNDNPKNINRIEEAVLSHDDK